MILELFDESNNGIYEYRLYYEDSRRDLLRLLFYLDEDRFAIRFR